MTGSRRMLLALLVLMAGLALVPSAFAGDVTLWACHGPSGGPLGSAVIGSNTTGDGSLTSYGVGCAGAVGGVADGGLQATFSRPDPAGGSFASLGVAVPAGVTLESVALTRQTLGFGGSPLSGDPLTYSASTPAGVLESSSVAGTNDVALSGTSSFPSATGDELTVGVACGLSGAQRCAAPGQGTVGVDVSALAITVSDTTPPRGAVGGVQSPIAGSENLTIVASDDGLGLASASAQWDGGPATTVEFGDSSCAPLSSSISPIDLALGANCPATVSGIPLSLSTAGIADGTHQLTVTLTDAAGNTTTLVNEPIQVLNNPPTPSATATLGVGSGATGATGAAGTGATGATGTTGSGSPSIPTGKLTNQAACASPQLTVNLHSKPQRIKRGVAVLIRKHVYSFAGAVTCLLKGRRVAAPLDTPIEIHAMIGKHITAQAGVALTRRGKFSVLLTFKKSQTIEFTYLTDSGSSLVAKERLMVVKPPSKPTTTTPAKAPAATASSSTGRP